MEGGSSSSNGTSYLLAFGENNSGGLCPMTMMPLVTSHHAGHHPINPSNNNNVNTNCLFIPNCSNSTGTPSIMLHNNHNNNKTDDDDNNNNTGLGYYFMESDHHHHHHGNNNNNGSSSSSSSSAVKAKIMAHPHYHRLLAAYVNCQKVGAPPEVVARLEEACASAATMAGGDAAAGSSCIGEDPALDQFMEAYCEMLTKYEQELSKPLKEAMLFLQRIECQFKNLTISSSDFASNEGGDRNGSSEEDVDLHNMIDPQAEDRDLKGQLLRKYSGYLGSLKQEFMKKRKKGKLPKEARQQLLEWWNRHYKWPYPSESQKLALAESTGLDQKQINNWFINQRKRHWKPSEDMQFVVMDPSHPHYYMDNVLGNPFPMDLSHPML
ncbi:hypothetical protein AAZX31_09G007300 [Glycine max]|uniref:Homeobox protein SBH1 n=3 Tax=Glycine subgen. Soja TaxID=1462606 RepID=HSBH1_SOYBN|nr:homeobox protein SBH1 [Glycine max]XP_028179759.1 homeobox protein SBH1 isoform X1 [Glycine soja]P46608.1 RecName: Full=Homeobox protein SBH1 [Glycine max]AAA20882.1 SBH1 [Glycine max]KAG5132463.1 hypothetical protein JHK82_023651 [Glycine max]KAH1040882.1 hypothetical protein GYH30_023642 [Glycine max]KRH36506.1 hypothetical protein GLYMA_09G007500v4 [Glycine max]RZB90008.1 Homeobox protein SBH1 isoform A [Glycine soja]|eukprot:NP_001238058.1 homeobox protein SBH1 [Glycine max]